MIVTEPITINNRQPLPRWARRAIDVGKNLTVYSRVLMRRPLPRCPVVATTGGGVDVEY